LRLKNTIGVEVGWQTIDFGKTMNQLTPDREFTQEKTKHHTSQLLAGLNFKF
jgi:hypothetical protein